jgi:hypothetical protein
MFRLPVTLVALLFVVPLHVTNAHAGASAVRVVIVLPASDRVPPALSRAAREVAAIWRTADVELRWVHELRDDEPRADRIITLVLTDDLPGPPPPAPRPLGAVQLVEGRMRQVMLVSPAAIRDLVARAGVTSMNGHFDTVYARLLGRVLAHELGHLLLNTTAHRLSGVMRPSFGSRDVVSGDAARFTLDRRDVAMLARVHAGAARLAANTPPAAAGTVVSGRR